MHFTNLAFLLSTLLFGHVHCLPVALGSLSPRSDQNNGIFGPHGDECSINGPGDRNIRVVVSGEHEKRTTCGNL